MTASTHPDFVSDAPRVTRATRASRPSAATWRHVLIAGCIIAAASVLAFTKPGTRNIDADLVLLLHGMAAIKSLMVLAAIAIIAWRFGHPIERRFTVGYLVGAFLVSAATAMIWQLTAIVPAALVFHVGGLLLLVVAWRDDGVPLRRRSR